MLKNKNNNKNSDGFITMIVMMLIILGVVIYLAYSNVISR
jgi:heme/copper-type cytochrome/quinol oxidase subunit 2